MDGMSKPQYRKAAVLALVTGLGLGLAACSSSKSGGTDANGKTVITVDCAPQKTDNGGKTYAAWQADIKAFETAHPDIDVESFSVGSQCDNPPDFTARLQGDTQADVFYGYATDLQQVLDANAAADLTSFINDQTVPNWKDIPDGIKAAYTDGGKIYAIPTYSYTMGLVYNKKIFQQAGLDPTKPPTTWQDVQADAKTIADKLGSQGIVGYQEYSAQNTGGWHFTAELYSRGGADLDSSGKANVDTPEGQAVLTLLHNMRFQDNSVGTKQLLGWADLLTNAAAGKVGMYVGAPDTLKAIVENFNGSYADWAISQMPGDNGAAKGSLGGGNGYFIKSGLTDAQVKAAIAWVNFEDLTIGQGQYNYVRQKADGVPVGLPISTLWTPGSKTAQAADTLAQSNSNLNLSDYAPYKSNPVPVVAEPKNAQAIYAVLDSAMAAALTQPNANIAQLLSTANTQIDQALKAAGG
jgi:ABC-type glycerol-3-phosphate transport system substrate-binding protein